ncbi:carbon-nitrogen hydrolase family protein [Acidipropionibacterium virtanenii]|uniref:Aliphatic amidase n=1 Tax=Acidipropionibacterium virtanenii TaxID=2057246 RepID=A0A344UVJ5_9ACTN|nr:carbon-nitrogen hydrolase family protein [Acidipropionibacterium virtanenii]AXE39293.1 Aliphatic amidase [Acidipropionibacterium virtanenii]
MSACHELTAVGVQATPTAIGAPLGLFRDSCREILRQNPDAGMLIWPEMHLFADGAPDRARTRALRAVAEPLDGPRVATLARIAAELGVWLVPGSVCELGPAGELFNTAVVLSPDGGLTASYRKIFPWRPSEPWTPGDRLCVFDIDGVGRFGLCICFDSWFPEVSRNLAWLGAETILNVVKTTTADRPQELVIARANAITQQVNFLTVNAAAPIGTGYSAAFGPQGEDLGHIDARRPGILKAVLSGDEVHRVRRQGTAGVTRPWAFFRPGDRPVDLPAYRGSIDPTAWNRD